MSHSRFRFPHSFTKAIAVLHQMHDDLRALVLGCKLPADDDTHQLLGVVEITILLTNQVLDLYGDVDSDE